MLKLALGSALLVTVTQTVAATLGPAQGDVIIGRPFDLLVQSRIEPNQARADLCLQAQLFYGEAAVEPGSISVLMHSAAADGAALLRVRSSVLVNEPIVTLVLQAGCQNVFRRSYTLLADFQPTQVAAEAPLVPHEPIAAAAVVTAAAPVPGPAATAASAPAAEEAALEPETPIRLTAPVSRPAALARASSKRAPLAVAAASAAPLAPDPVRESAPPAPAGARLQLDPVDLPAVGGPVAATQQAATEPAAADLATAAAPPVATEGQAAATPPDWQQQMQALRAEQERLQLALQTMNAQLLQAQALTRPVWPAYATYGLGALALLLLGGLWFALRSGRLVLGGRPAQTELPWWEPSLTSPASHAPAPDAVGAGGGASASAASATAAAAADLAQARPLASALQPTESATPANLPLPPEPVRLQSVVAKPSAVPPLAAVMPESLDAAFPVWLPGAAVEGMDVVEGRASMFSEVPLSVLDLGQLSDTWQQIAFCESIGQHRQAMDLLKAFVTEHPRASEAVYLRWLALASLHGSEADRSQATRFYENHFLRLAPRLQAIMWGQGLDDDTALLQALQRDWPQPTALRQVELSLGSQPGDPQSPLQVRTLAAFDDLLDLLGVLQGLGAGQSHLSVAALDVRLGLRLRDELGLPPLQSPAASRPAAPPPAAQGSATPVAEPMSLDFDLSRLDWDNNEPAPDPGAVSGKS